MIQKKLYLKSQFNVVDVGFNSLFLRASKDLVFLLEQINENCSSLKNIFIKMKKKLIRLFNYKKMTFKNIDLRNNTLTEIPSITNFFMLFADLKDSLINKKLIECLKKYYKMKNIYFPQSIQNINHLKKKGTGEVQFGSIVIGLFIKVLKTRIKNMQKQ